MLSRQFVSRRSKNFTSNVSVRMPPPVSVDHYLRSRKPARRDARATGARGPATRARKRPANGAVSRAREGRRCAGPRSCSIIPCDQYSGPFDGTAARPARQVLACFEHSNLFKVNVSARRRHSVKSTAQQDWSRRPPSAERDGRATLGRAARRRPGTRVRLPTIRPADVPVN